MISEQIITQSALLFKRLNEKFSDLSPVLSVISGIVNRAISRNFYAHGRVSGAGTGLFDGGDQQWTPLARSTIQKYKKLGYDPQPTLLRNKRLRSSIEVNPDMPSSISISANSPYARIHQKGGVINHPGGTPYVLIKSRKQMTAKFIKLTTAKKREAKGQPVFYTKPHKITIPARPYIVLNEKDLDEINETMAKFVILSQP
jgi:phage gpG-like protein